MNWSSHIRAIRARAGLTQKGLADRLGTSQAHISRIEAGHVEPRPDLAERIENFRTAPDIRGVLDGIIDTVRRSPDIICVIRPDGDDVRYVALSRGFRNHPQFLTLREGDRVIAEAAREGPDLVTRIRESGIFSGDVECVESAWLAEIRGFRNYWHTHVTPIQTDHDGRYLYCAMRQLDQAAYEALIARWDGQLRIIHYL